MLFKDVQVSFPLIEHGTVDCVLAQGPAQPWESQCKTAFRVKGRAGFRVDLVKQKSGVKIPYAQGDFEMLVVNIPDDPHRKFFIPASELSQRGFLSDGDAVKGKATLTVNVGAAQADSRHWTTRFLKGREDLIIQPSARPVHYDCPKPLPALPALLALRPVDITLPVHHDACHPSSPLPPSLVLAHHHNVIIQPSALPALCPADISITAITLRTLVPSSPPPLSPLLASSHISHETTSPDSGGKQNAVVDVPSAAISITPITISPARTLSHTMIPPLPQLAISRWPLSELERCVKICVRIQYHIQDS